MEISPEIGIFCTMVHMRTVIQVPRPHPSNSQEPRSSNSHGLWLQWTSPQISQSTCWERAKIVEKANYSPILRCSWAAVVTTTHHTSHHRGNLRRASRRQHRQKKMAGNRQTHYKDLTNHKHDQKAEEKLLIPQSAENQAVERYISVTKTDQQLS